MDDIDEPPHSKLIEPKPYDLLPLNQHPDFLAASMKKKYRWLMLFLLNIVIVGNYFCYDYPAYLEVNIEDEFDVTPQKYGLLYSVYGIPNLVLPFFSGMLYDRYGSRNCMNVFSFLVMVGQGVVMLGGYTMNYNLLLAGRFIYGIGCEN